MGESFWQNNSRVVTNILFELQPIIIFSPVAHFGDLSLVAELSDEFEKKSLLEQ